MSTTKKQLGVWMDHSNAHLIEMNTDSMESNTIESEFTHEQKEESLSKSEYTMHNKEQQQQGVFYKKLSDEISKFEEVILFGPTDAKLELLNLLKANHHFDNIKIEARQADKMTSNQQHAFVREYFSGN